jgi:hypothetical protein
MLGAATITSQAPRIHGAGCFAQTELGAKQDHGDQ